MSYWRIEKNEWKDKTTTIRQGNPLELNYNPIDVIIKLEQMAKIIHNGLTDNIKSPASSGESIEKRREIAEKGAPWARRKRVAARAALGCKVWREVKEGERT
ncbi:Uncharacterized protein Fot_20484 [Forsythia ovata]|uniref:Uncharacterized protein n=1 Tax=Forsythia ovata TaxID=205694 RepID=A0ABD1UTZ0_9LAMI